MSDNNQFFPDHLEYSAERLLKAHNLYPRSLLPEQSRSLARELRQAPSINRCRYRNGREEWAGDVTPTDYDRYLRDNREWFDARYPRERCYWPAALEYWLLYYRGNLPKFQPWLSWYAAILGDPRPDLPAPMYWRAVIYHLWKERSKEWRKGWEKDFTARHPDAERLEIFKGQNGNLYTEKWRPWAYVLGFKRTQAQWERDAIKDLANRREFAGLYA